MALQVGVAGLVERVDCILELLGRELQRHGNLALQPRKVVLIVVVLALQTDAVDQST